MPERYLLGIMSLGVVLLGLLLGLLVGSLLAHWYYAVTDHQTPPEDA